MSQPTYWIKGATIVNENESYVGHVIMHHGRIKRIFRGEDVSLEGEDTGAQVIDGSGKHLFPGIIDTQVHFREPGLTHKATISSETHAAVAGGVTSFLEMPNTKPPTLTTALLEEKNAIAKRSSLCNYGFFLGASIDNLDDIMKADPKGICGLKIFMGSSTGNMKVDEREVLEKIFSRAPFRISLHCEDDAVIAENVKKAQETFGDAIPMNQHAVIRSVEACYRSSSLAVELAKLHNARIHVLHVSTAKELSLFENTLPLSQKTITSEACVHHLWFCEKDYDEKGSLIKWNPAVKQASDRAALLDAVNDDRIDIIATDHAPHTFDEKQNTYLTCPSGAPMVGHGFIVMLELFKKGKISLSKIVEKMCHNPATLFDMKDRGFIREGYYADLVLVDLARSFTVSTENILYKCGWSPLEGETFSSSVTHTFVNGNLVFEGGTIHENVFGEQITFDR